MFRTIPSIDCLDCFAPIICYSELHLLQDVKFHLMDLVEARDCHLEEDCRKIEKREVRIDRIKPLDGSPRILPCKPGHNWR